MNPTTTFGSDAELAYRRERISHDLGQHRHAGRRHFWHRRQALVVVAPYGDARA